ncbi:MAG: glycosyltransferase family 2 protein [Acidobacteriota bacterium]
MSPSPEPDFSIVIPTHDRLDVLQEVLAALGAQEGSVSFEVVVVDDGSSDGTAEFLEHLRPAFPLRVLRQPNQGPAAARNAGVAAARGEWVAFLGDDTVPDPGWIRAHREAHRRREDPPLRGVLGYTGWHPRLRLSPFLRYINEHGLQFGYAIIRDPEHVPFNFFYTSNISLSRRLLLETPFHLDFPYPAWEDIEVGYRLQQKGFWIVYEPAARVAHDHPTSFLRFRERQEKAGYSAVVFYRLHPELGPFLGLGPGGPPPLPSALRQRWLEILVRGLQNTRLNLPRLWEETLRFHYIRGLQRGWRERMGETKEA